MAIYVTSGQLKIILVFNSFSTCILKAIVLVFNFFPMQTFSN